MATPQQIEAALRKAHAAGNTEHARLLAAELKKAQATPAAPSAPAQGRTFQYQTLSQELRGAPGETLTATPGAGLSPAIMANAQPPGPSRMQTFTQNAANSVLLGTGPYVRGARGAVEAGLQGKDMGQGFRQAEQDYRASITAGREAHPVTAVGGDIAGFIAPGGALAKVGGKVLGPMIMAAQRATPALGFGAKIGAGAAIGAADAALFGSTVQAENDASMQGRAPSGAERAETAKALAPWGAGAGAAAPLLAPALRPVGRAIERTGAQIGEALRLTPGAVQRFDEKTATNAVRRSLERSGILSIDDFAKRAAKYGDKPVVTGELGQDTLNSLVSLTRQPGTTSEKAMAVLEDRVQGFPARMLKDIADETGFTPEEVLGDLERLMTASRNRAAPLYEAAEATPFAETANLQRLVQDSPTLRSLMPKAMNRVQNQAVSRIGQADQMSPLKPYDELKQLLDEEINARIKNGQGIDDLEGLRQNLLRELDQISAEGADYARGVTSGTDIPLSESPYAVAREAGGDAPRLKAGMQAGNRQMQGGSWAKEVEQYVSKIYGGELTGFQLGAIRFLAKAIDQGQLTARRIYQKDFQAKLKAIFGDAAGDGLVRKFGAEADLMQKGARWNPNVGAVTSQAQMGGPSKALDDAFSLGANVLSGNKIGIARDFMRWARRQGYNEAQMNEIGNLLLTDPQEAAKRLFPGATPNGVPPTIPPAGGVRENQRPPPPVGPRGIPTGPATSSNTYNLQPERSGPPMMAPRAPESAPPAPGGGGTPPRSISSRLPLANIDAQTSQGRMRGTVEGDVFMDRGALVVSPEWPSAAVDDLVAAIDSRTNAFNRGPRLVKEGETPAAPAVPEDWARNNPEAANQVVDGVAQRFIGLAKSNPAPAHILPTLDGFDNWRLGAALEMNLPPGKILLRVEDGSEYAIVDKRWYRENPDRFPPDRWRQPSIQFNQKMGLVPTDPNKKPPSKR